MARGRKAKVTKPPTKFERSEKLRSRIVNLAEELISKGYGDLLKPPGPVNLIESPDADPKTDGFIGKAKETLGTYIQRVSVQDNFSQRPPFDHVNDPIYRRLIRDFIDGALMPEAKVAALSKTVEGHKASSLDQASELNYSIIDGLQRLYCFCIAILLVLDREKLVEDGYVPKEAWEYFSGNVTGTGDATAGTRELLGRVIRYEVFYNIDLGGLLHYMVTFNTGQRRMSLPVQLEIMHQPLIGELKQRAKIPVWDEMRKQAGMTKPRDQFSAADLVLATQAFISASPQVTATDEAERFLNESQAYLDNVGDIKDVVHTFRRLATEVHPKVMAVYSEDINKRYVFSSSILFLLGLMAACGYVRNRNNLKMLDGALDKLGGLLQDASDDPLNLEEYQEALATITSSRGKATRRLVYDTFLRFFSGATKALEWRDTASQITGAML